MNQNNSIFNNIYKENIIKCSFLLIGLSNIGKKIAKLLINLNINKLTIIDDTLEICDNSTEKRISEIYRKYLAKINPDVELSTAALSDINYLIPKYDFTIVSKIYNFNNLVEWNNNCRENNKKFIYANNAYLKGIIFLDFKLVRIKKKFIAKKILEVEHITNEVHGIVKTKTPHLLKNYDYVSFYEIKGMEELNGPEGRPVRIKNKTEFIIENTLKFGKYDESGKVIKLNVPCDQEFKNILYFSSTDFLKNEELLEDYNISNLNIIYYYFNLLKEEQFIDIINDPSKSELIDDYINNSLTELNNKDNIVNKTQLEMLINMLIMIFKNKPDNDFLFNNYISNLVINEIYKSFGVYKNKNIIIIDFLNFFPNINSDLSNHITKTLTQKSYKILVIGYNKYCKKLIKYLSKVAPLNNKNIIINILDLKVNSETCNMLKTKNVNTTINFIDKKSIKDNKIFSSFNTVFCLSKQIPIILKIYELCNINKVSFCFPLIFNSKIKVIDSLDSFELKDQIYFSYLANFKSETLSNMKFSIKFIKYIEIIYKIIFEIPIEEFKFYFDKKETITYLNLDNMLFVSLFIKLKIIEMLNLNVNIDSIIDLGYYLILKLINLELLKINVTKFYDDNKLFILYCIKYFCILVVNLLGQDTESNFKEINNKTADITVQYSIIQLTKKLGFEVKFNLESYYYDVKKMLGKNNYKYHISFSERIKNKYEDIIVNFIYSLSTLASNLLNFELNINQKDIKYIVTIFNNNENYSKNLIILMVISKIAKSILEIKTNKTHIIDVENNIINI